MLIENAVSLSLCGSPISTLVKALLGDHRGTCPEPNLDVLPSHCVCVCVSVCIFEMEVLRTWQYTSLATLLSPQIKDYIQEEDLKREK